MNPPFFSCSIHGTINETPDGCPKCNPELYQKRIDEAKTKEAVSKALSEVLRLAWMESKDYNENDNFILMSQLEEIITKVAGDKVEFTKAVDKIQQGFKQNND